jgi:hypothetical protein
MMVSTTPAETWMTAPSWAWYDCVDGDRGCRFGERAELGGFRVSFGRVAALSKLGAQYVRAQLLARADFARRSEDFCGVGEHGLL